MAIKATFNRLRRSARFAALLWLVLAFLVWNVVFDRILVLAGRRYSYAAAVSARNGQGYVLINDWMRPAVRYGVKVATATAIVVAAIGLVGVALATRVERKRQAQG